MGIVSSNTSASAQIIPDATLGTENSRLTPGSSMQGFPADRIDGGAIRGGNLFHSFLEFNINTGQRVYFANPTGIQNIFSRVTGSNASRINGTLGVDGVANLFLLNPHGILFGPNARLDIQGSFLATTAHSIQFLDGSEFSATNSQATLLTISVPKGVQYGATASGTIASSGNLSVGQNLTLSAENLDLQGQLRAGGDLTLQAQNTLQIRDSVTTPFVAASGGQLLVQGNQTVDIFALNHPSSRFFSGTDLVLRSAQPVMGDAHFSSQRSFRVEQLDGTPGNLSSPHDPIILALGDVTLGDYAGASLHILAGGSVTLGNVTINGLGAAGETISPFNPNPFLASLATVPLSDGTTIAIDGSSTPTLDVRAGVNWGALGGFPFADPTVIGALGSPLATSAPSAANITVNGAIFNTQTNGVVLLTNQFQPTTAPGNIAVNGISTFLGFIDSGPIILDSRGDVTPAAGAVLDARSFIGNGGGITIQAVGDVSLNNARLVSNSVFGGTGNGGTIEIAARSLLASNASLLDTSTFGGGNGGDIQINTRDRIVFDSGSIAQSLAGAGLGNAGNIQIKTSSLILNGNSSLNSSVGDSITPGQGNAGNVNVTADNLSLTGGSTILSLVASGSSGNAGDVNITVSGAAEISGNNSRIENSISSGAVGSGGRTTIQAGSLTIAAGARLEASTSGQGNAGDVTITTRDGVFLQRGNIRSDVKAGAIGNAGNVLINTNTFSMTSPGSATIDTRITGRVDAGGTGNGGKITINANSALIDNSAISFTTSGKGNAGVLAINAQNLTLRSDAGLAGDVGGGGDGFGGNISLNVPGTLLLDGATDPGVNIAPTGESTRITAGVLPGGSGEGGNVRIQAGALIMQNGAIIKNSTQGKGDAVIIQVNANQVDISGSVPQSGLPSGLFTSTATDFKAGDIAVNTGSFRLADAAVLSARSTANGKGGDITVNASGAFAAINGGQLVATTFGAGKAGDIRVSAAQVILTGSDPNYGDRLAKFPNPLNPSVANAIKETGAASGLFASAIGSAPGGNLGKGGNIQITSGEVSIAHGAGIAVNSNAAGAGFAGTINVGANILTLSDNAFITAETSSGAGGNIQLNLQDVLLLRRNSVISTTAGSTTSGGNGGNIIINLKKGFVVAVPNENSDIIANAFGGKGGTIQISTIRVLGLEERGRLTPAQIQEIRRNGTSDISASSDLGSDGQVAVESLGIDPSQGLIDLPLELVDPTSLIAQSCGPSSDFAAKPQKQTQQNRFVITGRGGLPPNPEDPQLAAIESTTWVVRRGERSKRASIPDLAERPALPSQKESPLNAPVNALVEAQGMLVAPNGEIVLVAQVGNATPYVSGLPGLNCRSGSVTQASGKNLSP